jgi:hypothetical protein
MELSSKNKQYVCKSIYGPYDGPYCKNIITYFLYDSAGNKVAWHFGPNKDLGCKINDVITGIVIEKCIVNYKKSKPKIIKNQLTIDI